MTMDGLQTLLERTNLTVPFNTLIKQIESEFPAIGILESVTPINEGYEDANIILNALTGKYVLKIFLKERNQQTISDYVRVIYEANKVGVPTVELIQGEQGLVSSVNGNREQCQFIITKYFEGKNFQTIPPTQEEMVEITGFLAKLNTLNFLIEDTYDSWGNKNILKEYEVNKDKLTADQLALIKPVIQEFKTLEFNSFSKAVIHGDMQRKHVLKSVSGKYCILDYGCMSFDAKVIDLSTYLAWFCLNDQKSWRQRNEIYEEVVKEYCKTHKLTDIELVSLKPLVCASYAAYYQTTSVMINEGDTSGETLEWHNQAEEMLKLYQDW
jgi:Ser/Thr protein kinase RdoA (MazF antagonist)